MKPANTVLLYALIARHQRDTQGNVTGVTPAEIDREWLATHGVKMTRGALQKLSEAEVIRRLPRVRPCSVAGTMRRPWVTA